MKVSKEHIKDIIAIRERINSISEGFYNSTTLAEAETAFPGKIRYDIFDIQLAAGITASPVLFTGHTDKGKTDLAKIMMTALLGNEDEQWHRVDVDLDFGKETYLDTQFDAITEGKSSQSLYEILPFLTFPGLILDELNRAPPKIINKILHFYDNDIHLPNGKRLKTGLRKRDLQYQFIVAAINEGEEYLGTFGIDKALRRRTLVEIPMDCFPPTEDDKLQITRNRRNALQITKGEGMLEEVLALYSMSKNIPVSAEPEHFKLFLQSMSKCLKSETGIKEGIEFGEHLCTKGNETQAGSCHAYALYPNNMCSMVTGISEGVGINMDRLAAGLAMVRAMKVVQELGYYLKMAYVLKNGNMKEVGKKMRISQEKSVFEEHMKHYVKKKNVAGEDLAAAYIDNYISRLRIEPCDYIALFPFVCYSKIGLNKAWISKNYQGSRFKALVDIAEGCYEHVHGFSQDFPKFTNLIHGNKVNLGDIEAIEKDVKDNPWMKASLEPYIKKADPGLRDIVETSYGLENIALKLLK